MGNIFSHKKKKSFFSKKKEIVPTNIPQDEIITRPSPTQEKRFARIIDSNQFDFTNYEGTTSDTETIVVKREEPPINYTFTPFTDYPFVISENQVKPMLLYDTTSSMNLPISEGSDILRKSVAEDALKLIVDKLAIYNYPANAKGLQTVTFSSGSAYDISPLDLNNCSLKMSKIIYGGSTYILPGWKKIREIFNNEFPGTKKPVLLCLVITDGIAEDLASFMKYLEKIGSKDIYICFALIGYGSEYETARSGLLHVGTRNPHIRTLEFKSETNPELIADACFKFLSLS